MPSVEIITFGCRLNAFESDIIRRAAAGAGLNDAIIVNTCAVTAEAERQARQAIRRARREHPGARIIVTGCAATLSPTQYAQLDGVDLVLDNEANLQAESYRQISKECHSGTARRAGPGIQENRLVFMDSGFAAMPRPGMTPSVGQPPRVRAYLQVQQGCDHRCTFCIIPYARGPSRSVPLAAIIEQARELAEHGVREIVLTGVDLTPYG